MAARSAEDFKSGALLNVGCGATFHPDWTNLDVEPRGPRVQKWDVRERLPFPDGLFAAVYSSHVLEHLDPLDAQRLVRELHRVLQPSGLIRLVVPNLEGICRAYLQSLDAAWDGRPQALGQYQWMVLELLDQMVRTGGSRRMVDFLRAIPAEQRPFVQTRIGMEAERIWVDQERSLSGRVARRVKDLGPGWVVDQVRRRLAVMMARLVGGREVGAALSEGLHRLSGEPHRWMYDRVSLRTLLIEAGFSDFRVRDAWTSAIPRFVDYQLDTSGDVVRKPDSIFVEARRG